MLKISNLVAGYQDLQVLNDVSFELPAGKVGVLMGPNGAGKSTLLKAIFNLVEVTSGQIEFNHTKLTGLPTYSLLERGIGYVPQGKINFGALTVLENLQMGAYHLEDKALRTTNLYQVLAEFPALETKKNEYAFRLSGGQQQMLALGRALMNVPKLLLLDEPSLGLSPKLVKEVFAKIRHINEKFGTTILIVEHNIKSVLTIADYGYVLSAGRLLAQGTNEELQRSPILNQVFVGKLE